ncbi:MAG: OsmC family peroxiredoxin [Marinilabiliales bacterium]|nr:MAG: OsmC family peroxiredoxin [Marinilabiliales bacterium]
MSKHYAKATWKNKLVEGNGVFELKSGYRGNYSFKSRFEDDKSISSPEELIGAAHASCFSMALAHALDQSGFTPVEINTDAEVTLSKSGDGFAVTGILLKTKGRVKGIDNDRFLEIASDAKDNCPVSKALEAVSISLEAELIQA